MADRGTFDASRSGSGSTVARGKHVARLNVAGVGRTFGSAGHRIAPSATHGGRIAVPEARVSSTGKVSFGAGAGGFATAQQLGMSSVPVAMSKQSWRNAARAGLISREGGPIASNDGKRARVTAGDIVVTIDTRDLARIGAQLEGAGMAIRKGHEVISRAINFGMRSLRTQLKRDARNWTGLPIRQLDGAFKMFSSTPATLTGVLKVTDRHHMIARGNFGATWQRSDPGAYHRAWNRPQLAVGAFLAGSLAPVFKRTGVRIKMDKGRYKGRVRERLAPLWGPNTAREIDKHRPTVQARLNVINASVVREAERLVRVAIARGR